MKRLFASLFIFFVLSSASFCADYKVLTITPSSSATVTTMDAGGIRTTGYITAASFAGDGAKLTNVPAGALAADVNISTTGYITAASFSGNGSSLTSVGELIYIGTKTFNVSASPQTFEGLNGNADLEYILTLSGTITAFADTYILARLNADKVAGHYLSNAIMLFSNGIETEVPINTGLAIGRNGWGDAGTFYATAHIQASTTKRYRQSGSHNKFIRDNGFGSIAQQITSSAWNDWTTNITSIEVAPNGHTFTGTVDLYKVKR